MLVQSLVQDDPLAEGMATHPLQYFCPENPMDRGAWRATVDRVAKSQTLVKRLSTHPVIRAICDRHTQLEIIMQTKQTPNPQTTTTKNPPPHSPCEKTEHFYRLKCRVSSGLQRDGFRDHSEIDQSQMRVSVSGDI